ncbi:MAG TPA: hypothetical protein VF142_03545 [Longimicrobium sp.]
MIRRLALGALLASIVLSRPAEAQTTRPWLDWRTLRTEHFDVHFPAELEPWTRDVASRLEGVYASVGGLVGSVPEQRVTIVVDDPAGEANGSAFSFLRTPYILLYPTPPDPRSVLGHTRGAAEQLVVHEFAHVAHLTRPSRNPLARWTSGFDPRGLGPLARTAPRWVREGYATYVEGRLTGYGRPYGVVRAAILRQWALEGRLPPYTQLDASAGAYQMPGMAYLAGSAFLEWLAARRGDESLTQLWRRMSARQARTFDQAFTGVYGATPQELYGLFTVELTASALQARGQLAQAGVVTGDTVQHLAWGTGDVAVSPDGRHMAVTLGGPTRAWSRLVVWRTDAPNADSADAAADAALLARDPQDVPAYRVWPRARPAVATLRPEDGLLPYRAPRFLPGGEELLVVRAAPIGGGATREDLFAWRWRTGAVRRVTDGAGIRAADPHPDGRRAAAVQCRDGFCGLVMVDLASGALASLAPGTTDRVFDRPRVSPDGRTIAAAMQEGGSWKLVTVPVDGGAPTVVYGGGASAYDPAWTPDGAALVATDERTGIANLVRVGLADGSARQLTSVVGAASAPEVDPATGGVYYLSLHAGGWDVYRIHPDSAPTPIPVALPAALAPVVRQTPPMAADTLPREALPPSRPYGMGPRWTRLFPMGAVGMDGGAGGVIVHNADPVGRLALAVRGAWGDAGLERGAAAEAAWRGWRPSVTGEAFWIAQDPARLPGYDTPGLDARYGGAVLSTGNAWSEARNAQEWRLGASAGRLSLVDGDAGARTLGFARYAVSDGRRMGSGYANGALTLAGAAGRTHGEDWARGTLTAAFNAGTGSLGVRAEATLGRVSGGAPGWERFALGGMRPLLANEMVMSQRVPMPALRFGALEGEDLLTYRVSTSLGALTPYFWGGTTDPAWEGWLRVAGVELAASFPGFRAAATPGARLLAGVAYGLDGAYENDLTAYFGIDFTP